MKSKKNLTRFTYETTAFQGWRLCISRAGATFTRYFSDKQLLITVSWFEHAFDPIR